METTVKSPANQLELDIPSPQQSAYRLNVKRLQLAGFRLPDRVVVSVEERTILELSKDDPVDDSQVSYCVLSVKWLEQLKKAMADLVTLDQRHARQRTAHEDSVRACLAEAAVATRVPVWRALQRAAQQRIQDELVDIFPDANPNPDPDEEEDDHPLF